MDLHLNQPGRRIDGDEERVGPLQHKGRSLEAGNDACHLWCCLQVNPKTKALFVLYESLQYELMTSHYCRTRPCSVHLHLERASGMAVYPTATTGPDNPLHVFTPCVPTPAALPQSLIRPRLAIVAQRGASGAFHRHRRLCGVLRSVQGRSRRLQRSQGEGRCRRRRD